MKRRLTGLLLAAAMTLNLFTPPVFAEEGERFEEAENIATKISEDAQEVLLPMIEEETVAEESTEEESEVLEEIVLPLQEETVEEEPDVFEEEISEAESFEEETEVSVEAPQKPVQLAPEEDISDKLIFTNSEGDVYVLDPEMLESEAAFEQDTSLAAGDTVTVQIDVEYAQTQCRAMLDTINTFRTDGKAWVYTPTGAVVNVGALPALQYDYKLEAVAMLRAAEIALKYDHTRPNGERCFTAYDELGYGSAAAGENIAMGQRNANEAYTGWLEENVPYSKQGHRRNMLSLEDVGDDGSLRKVGTNRIGIAGCFYKGTWHWVQEFGAADSGAADPGACDSTTTVPVKVLKSSIVAIAPFAENSSISAAVGDTVSLPTCLKATIFSNVLNVSSFETEVDVTTWQSLSPELVTVSGNTATVVGEGTAYIQGSVANVIDRLAPLIAITTETGTPDISSGNAEVFIPAGESAELTFTAPETGTYLIYPQLSFALSTELLTLEVFDSDEESVDVSRYESGSTFMPTCPFLTAGETYTLRLSMNYKHAARKVELTIKPFLQGITPIQISDEESDNFTVRVDVTEESGDRILYAFTPSETNMYSVGGTFLSNSFYIGFFVCDSQGRPIDYADNDSKLYAFTAGETYYLALFLCPGQTGSLELYNRLWHTQFTADLLTADETGSFAVSGQFVSDKPSWFTFTPSSAIPLTIVNNSNNSYRLSVYDRIHTRYAAQSMTANSVCDLPVLESGVEYFLFIEGTGAYDLSIMDWYRALDMGELTLDENENFSATLPVADGKTRWFRFVPTKTTTYIFAPSSTRDDDVAVFSMNRQEVFSSFSSKTELLTAGTVYYVRLSRHYYSNSEADMTLRVCPFYRETTLTPITDLQFTVETVLPYFNLFYSFTPATDNIYELRCVDIDDDAWTSFVMFDSEGNALGDTNYMSSVHGGKLSCSMKGGETYYLRACPSNSYTGWCTVAISGILTGNEQQITLGSNNSFQGNAVVDESNEATGCILHLTAAEDGCYEFIVDNNSHNGYIRLYSESMEYLIASPDNFRTTLKAGESYYAFVYYSGDYGANTGAHGSIPVSITAYMPPQSYYPENPVLESTNCTATFTTRMNVPEGYNSTYPPLTYRLVYSTRSGELPAKGTRLSFEEFNNRCAASETLTQKNHATSFTNNYKPANGEAPAFWQLYTTQVDLEPETDYYFSLIYDAYGSVFFMTDPMATTTSALQGETQVSITDCQFEQGAFAAGIRFKISNPAREYITEIGVGKSLDGEHFNSVYLSNNQLFPDENGFYSVDFPYESGTSPLTYKPYAKVYSGKNATDTVKRSTEGLTAKTTLPSVRLEAPQPTHNGASCEVTLEGASGVDKAYIGSLYFKVVAADTDTSDLSQISYSSLLDSEYSIWELDEDGHTLKGRAVFNNQWRFSPNTEYKLWAELHSGDDIILYSEVGSFRTTAEPTPTPTPTDIPKPSAAPEPSVGPSPSPTITPDEPDVFDPGQESPDAVPTPLPTPKPEGFDILSIPAQAYTGAGIKPDVQVFCDGVELTLNVDYTVSYSNNKNAYQIKDWQNPGSKAPRVTVKGKGNYTGSQKVYFEILKPKVSYYNSWWLTDIAGGSISLTASSMTYGGEIPRVKAVYDSFGNRLAASDYVVTYSGTNKVGTATVCVTAQGTYFGTLTKSFKVKTIPLTDASVSISEEGRAYVYGGAKPAVNVALGGKLLTAGRDYTVTYSQNKAAGSYASVTVKGKGIYSGTALQKPGFLVGQSSLNDTRIVVSAPLQGKKPTVAVYDLMGKKLSNKKDYIADIQYNTAGTGGTVQLLMGTKQNYTARTEAPVEFSFVSPLAKSNIISSVKLNKDMFAAADLTYWGGTEQLLPSNCVTVKVKSSPLPVSPDKYEVICLGTNAAGKATAIVRAKEGSGIYGSKVISYKIKPRTIRLFDLFF